MKVKGLFLPYSEADILLSHLLQTDELLITGEEESEYEVRDIKRELQSLAALQDFTEDDVPTAEQLEVLEQYLLAAEEYVASEDNRKALIAQSVARGEMSVDALAEQLEEVPDMEAELLEGADDEDDLDAVEFDDEEDDGQQWVERIIELTRVTKVLIMDARACKALWAWDWDACACRLHDRSMCHLYSLSP